MNYKSGAIWSVAPDVTAFPFTLIDGAVNAYHVHLSMRTAGVRRKTFSYPGADGGVDKGYTLDPLRMVWELFVKADTESAFETKRENIYRLFKPFDSAIKIRCDLVGLGPLREIDAIVDGPVDFQQSKQLGFSALVRVPLYAPNGLWHSTSEVIETSTLPGSSMIVAYSGNYMGWPVIEIVGQVTDLVLTTTLATAYRTETSVIKLIGTTVADGDTYVIDMRGSVKRAYGTSPAINRIDKLVDPSWLNFKLHPIPIEYEGYNVVNYTYASKNANARVRFRFYNQYIGY